MKLYSIWWVLFLSPPWVASARLCADSTFSLVRVIGTVGTLRAKSAGTTQGWKMKLPNTIFRFLFLIAGTLVWSFACCPPSAVNQRNQLLGNTKNCMSLHHTFTPSSTWFETKKHSKLAVTDWTLLFLCTLNVQTHGTVIGKEMNQNVFSSSLKKKKKSLSFYVTWLGSTMYLFPWLSAG